MNRNVVILMVLGLIGALSVAAVVAVALTMPPGFAALFALALAILGGERVARIARVYWKRGQE